MTNTTIRTLSKEKGIRLWQVAKRLGITDSSFSRKLREELSERETNRIINIIEELSIEHEKS